ncbi:MAG: SDR family NAD(P)-dependent oxidoreductase, partial [Terriglobia bacterium]
ISSVAGRLALPYMAGYCATKFALNALSTGLRMELAREGVRVVVVCPGRVKTEFRHNMRLTGSRLPDVMRRRESTGITAEEVARVTLRALRSGRRMVVVPWRLRLAIGFRALLPKVFDAVLPRMMG